MFMPSAKEEKRTVLHGFLLFIETNGNYLKASMLLN